MTAETITLRLASLIDAERIAAMSRDLIEFGLGWSWTPQRVARSILNPETVVLIACADERFVGFVIMEFGEERAHLALLAVRPTYQRRGIGQCMIEWLLRSAQTAGIARVYVELRLVNFGARYFYRRLGFSEVGYLRGYYRGLETALRMVLELRPRNIAPPEHTDFLPREINQPRYNR